MLVICKPISICFCLAQLSFLGSLLLSSSLNIRFSSITLLRESKLTLLNAIPNRIVPSQLPDLSQKEFPVPPDCGYDLIVLGVGPAGESAAIHAAKLGAKVAVVEKKLSFGGPTGLTSKAIREAAKRICNAVDQIGGDRCKQVRGLWKRKFPVLKSEAEVLQAAETRDKLKANGCDLYIGIANFIEASFPTNDKTIIRVCRPTMCVELEASHVCIATGSRPHRPRELRPGVMLPFSKGKVVDATEMGSLTELPRAVAIIGGGVIAVEYATVLSELGVGVTLFCSESSFLPFLDEDLRFELRRRMAKSHILIESNFIEEILVNETVEDRDIFSREIFPRISDHGDENNRKIFPVKILMNDDGKRKYQRVFSVDLLLYSGGRDANSDGLDCECIQIQIGKYGQINVDNNLKTTGKGSIFAIGDVIGPPGLASSAQQQGRFVSDSLFRDMARGSSDYTAAALAEESEESESDFATGVDDFFDKGNASADESEALLFGSTSGAKANDAPLTLWTIPEIASVGLTLQQALSKGYTLSENTDAAPSKRHRELVQGFAYFKDSARGRLSGDPNGFLKVIAYFDEGSKKHKILGVHIIGEGANELIQLGSVILHSKSTLETVSNTPFAAVTLSGLYQVACDDALYRQKKKSLS